MQMNLFLYHFGAAFRSIFKGKIYSLFNIIGFALGFTICIISGIYIYREYNVDKCYKGYQDIYRIVDDEKNLSSIDYDIAQRLKDQFPEIKYTVPAAFINIDFKIRPLKEEDKSVTIKNLISTENDFFKVFQMDFLAGDPSKPFTSDLSIIVTQSTAEKLFGRTDIIGEQLFTPRGIMPVSAVIKDIPINSSLQADIFFNSKTVESRIGQACIGGNEICYNPYPVYALLNDRVDKKSLEEKINSNFPQNYSSTKKVRLQPLTDIYFDKTVTDNRTMTGSRSLVYIFATIAIIILILSVINYVNFALSRQLGTLKQTGIKMANGASMKQLREYYMAEISLSVFISFILSLLFCVLSLPLFEYILGVELSLASILTPLFIVSILLVLCIVILLSSATPFYIISRFDIQMLFGKKHTYFGKQWGKMILTGCQMVITVIMFICLFMLQKQLDYVKNYDLGFDKQHLIKINTYGENDCKIFRNEIAQYGFIENVAYSGGAPGFSYYTESNENEITKEDITIYKIYSEPSFITTFDIELLQGRNFTEADRGKSCIVTEETVKQLGWENIDGKICSGYQVIGVIKDIKISSLHNGMEPVNIIYAEEGAGPVDFINIKFKGNVPEVLDQLSQSWKKVISEKPFEYHFYDEVFDSYYKKEERQSTAIAIFSLVAIVITCMGLIGQVMQTSLSKAKEIGIRKINGASIAEMMMIIPGNFLKCFAVAFVVAIPIAWYAMDKWLQNFAYKTPVSWWIFALSGLAVLILLSLSVIWQTWKSATANPAEVIKNE